MKKKIENPKVFLSYAWGDDDYQNMVLTFASQLVGDGIDVVFDKWDLTEGNDTYAFMEKCATDPSITNVLMLLDPIYAQKADGHTGGVGTETQIISAKVYQEVTQDKFIPVVMRRDNNGNVCKPTYLQGRLHFDLSKSENYDETYQRLVRKLYGIETYVKPELGKEPQWVENISKVTHKTVVAYNSLRDGQPQKIKKMSLVSFLTQLSSRIVAFVNDEGKDTHKLDDYLALYDSFEEIRDDFLQLLKGIDYVEEGIKRVGEFFEETWNSISTCNSLSAEVAKVRLHEMFLYTIAGLLKNKDYSEAGYLLGRTYFNSRRYKEEEADSFKMLYSGSEHQNLDNAVKKRDNKRYYTGTGQHWIETLASDFCNKEQLIFADLICLNVSIYGNVLRDNWPWFPILYVYDKEYNSQITGFAKRMISKEYVEDILPLFGYKSIDGLKVRFQEVEGLPTKAIRDIRYNDSFDSAKILGDYITSDKIATLR